MSIVAVQAFTKGLLDGLASPYFEPAQAWITPLPIGEGGPAPQIYLWTPGIDEKRLNNPRASVGVGSGKKTVTHTLTMHALAIWDNTDPQNDVRFQSLLDAIGAALRGANVPAVITDPKTGVSSQLLSIGETIQVETDIVRAVSDQRLFRWLALIKTDAVEVINA